MAIIAEELDALAEKLEDEYQANKALSDQAIEAAAMRGYSLQGAGWVRVHAAAQGLRGQAETLRRNTPRQPAEREKPVEYFWEGNRPVDKLRAPPDSGRY